MRALLIAIVLLAPAPAFAARGDVGCIAEKLGPVTIQRIGDKAVAALDSGADFAQALDADRDALLAARDACRIGGGWSSGATDIAISYMQALAMKLGAESALRRDGLDPVNLAATYSALPPADRMSRTEKPTRAVLAAMAAATPRVAERRHVLLLFAALAGLEIYAADFAAA